MFITVIALFNITFQFIPLRYHLASNEYLRNPTKSAESGEMSVDHLVDKMNVVEMNTNELPVSLNHTL